MHKLTRLLCSLILPLAVVSCASPSLAPAVLLKPNTIKVQPLPAWIQAAGQQPRISTGELQLILNGSGRPGTTLSTQSKPALQPTMP